MNKCQEIGGKRTKVFYKKKDKSKKNCRGVHVQKRCVSYGHKHVSLSVPKIQPKMMVPILCVEFSIIYNSIGVHACVCASIVTSQLYATFFSNLFYMFGSELGQPRQQPKKIERPKTNLANSK